MICQLQRPTLIMLITCRYEVAIVLSTLLWKRFSGVGMCISKNKHNLPRYKKSHKTRHVFITYFLLTDKNSPYNMHIKQSIHVTHQESIGRYHFASRCYKVGTKGTFLNGPEYFSTSVLKRTVL